MHNYRSIFHLHSYLNHISFMYIIQVALSKGHCLDSMNQWSEALCPILDYLGEL